MPQPYSIDVAILGGGLAGSLGAYALSLWHPRATWRLFEAEPQLGGNHTWGFHKSDLDPHQYQIIKPFIEFEWTGYDVKFPNHSRTLAGTYCALTSLKLHQTLSSRHHLKLKLKTHVEKMDGDTIVLDNGECWKAGLIIDARGLATSNVQSQCAYQKFVGLEITLDKEHGLKRPVLMDATVPQTDGYRFFYLLPFDQRKLLVEDTYYSLSPTLDEALVEKRVLDYAKDKDWRIKSVQRLERGVLPIPLSHLKKVQSQNQHVVSIGMGSGLFHSTTGYSLPDLLRTLEIFRPSLDPSSVQARKAKRVQSWRQQQKFFRLLNRMLFFTLPSEHQYLIMQRFYEISEAVIQRFYRGELTWLDKIRIFALKPPVPIGKAVTCIKENQHA